MEEEGRRIIRRGSDPVQWTEACGRANGMDLIRPCMRKNAMDMIAIRTETSTVSCRPLQKVALHVPSREGDVRYVEVYEVRGPLQGVIVGKVRGVAAADN